MVKVKQNKKSTDNKKTLMTFKMDKDVKQKMHTFAEKVGMPVSVLLNVMVKNTLRSGRLDVSVKLPTVNSLEELDAKLNESMNSRLIPYEKTWLHKKMKELKMEEGLTYAGAI